MSKVSVIVLAMTLFTVPTVSFAGPDPHDNEADTSAVELKINRSLLLIEGARRVVDESGSPEAAALMDEAEASSREAAELFESGEYESARKAVMDSIQAAVNAIVASKGRVTGSERDKAMKEKAVDKAASDRDRAEAGLEKLAAEVETFFKAAERLSGLPDANASITEGRRLYASSIERSAEGDHDGALGEMRKAYRLATSGVRELKRSRGEVITFPPPALTGPKDLLAYEFRKNETYAFFSSRILDEKGDAGSRLREASDAREEAMRSMRSGDTEKALDRIRRSTELYINAIRSVGR